MYKASDYHEKLEAYKARDMSQQDFDKFMTSFNEAIDAGKVLDDLSAE